VFYVFLTKTVDGNIVVDNVAVVIDRVVCYWCYLLCCWLWLQVVGVVVDPQKELFVC
jgi:hypothetical protein